MKTVCAPSGNVYDKYGTRNPIERRLVRRFLTDLETLVASTEATEAHEVGCGEGELSMLLARRGLRVRGSDASPAVVAEARERARSAGLDIGFTAAAIEELDPGRDGAELVVCCEVLEHVADPDAGLEVIARLARPWAVLSVPREPLWRALNLARFKYLAALGNTPGHRQHWSRRAFLDFVAARLEVVAVRTPLPWTMALCRAA
jgi:2-polyprenyl-3-methyl-5-hydroxy-6-metoxy-1,4-benzoquinol methylase